LAVGEFTTATVSTAREQAPVERLTCNPRLGELLEQVDEFLAANSFRVAHPSHRAMP